MGQVNIPNKILFLINSKRDNQGLFGMSNLNLYTGINIYETIWTNLRKQLLTCLDVVFSLFQ
jgi:hypothetical protein